MDNIQHQNLERNNKQVKLLEHTSISRVQIASMAISYANFLRPLKSIQELTLYHFIIPIKISGKNIIPLKIKKRIIAYNY